MNAPDAATSPAVTQAPVPDDPHWYKAWLGQKLAQDTAVSVIDLHEYFAS